jgi:hypothetical protein
LFERFLENLVFDYLEKLCLELKEFDKLPSEIRENSIILTLDALKNIRNPRFRDFTESQLIANLNLALNDNKATLIFEAFQYHTLNFRHEVVSDYFKNIGVKDISGLLKRCDPLKSFLENEYRNISNIKDKILFRTINDLSQKRNDVSHGVENIEVLNSDIIKEYIHYVRLYCRTLFEILEQEYLSVYFRSLNYNPVVPIKVIDGNIICFSTSNRNLSVGDYLIFEKPISNYPRYFKCEVYEIQVNKKSYKKLSIDSQLNVAVRVSLDLKENCKFKFISTSK